MRVAILFLVSLGCNGGKDGDGKPAETGSTGDTGPFVTYEPTWEGVQALVTDECVRCHPSQQDVDLQNPDDPYGILFYVVPGDSAGSVLWQVLSQDPAPFPSNSMPYREGLLPLPTVDHVRVWIDNGAVVE